MQLNLTHAVIRTLCESDAESLTRYLNNKNVSQNTLTIPYPYTLADAREHIAKALPEKNSMHCVIANDTGAIGGIGFGFADPGFQDVQKHVAEIGYWLAQEFWGRGIMSEAVAAFTRWGVETLGLRRIHAATFARNRASARVLEKAGYQFEGRERARYFRDGEFHDGLRFACVSV